MNKEFFFVIESLGGKDWRRAYNHLKIKEHYPNVGNVRYQ